MNQNNANSTSLRNMQVGLKSSLTGNHSQETNLVLEDDVPNHAISAAVMNAVS